MPVELSGIAQHLQKGEHEQALERVREAVEAGERQSVTNFLDETLRKIKADNNAAAEATVLVAKSEIARSVGDGQLALKCARDAVTTANMSKDKKYVECPALQALIHAYLLQNMVPNAIKIAKDFITAASRHRSEWDAAKEKETLGDAWQMMGLVHLASATQRDPDASTPEDAMYSADKAGTLYKEAGSQKGRGRNLLLVAKIHLLQETVETAIEAAQEAVTLWRGVGVTKMLVTALEVLIQGLASQGDSLSGLRTAHEELAAMKRAGNTRGEADLLELIAQTHATLGEPVGALEHARSALLLYQSLSDTLGQAWASLTIAQMLRATGDMQGALHASEKALKLFKVTGSNRGEDEARSTMSTIMVAKGSAEKAPNRKQAIALLKDLVNATSFRDADKFKRVEKQLDAMAEMITEKDMEDMLGPVLMQDPEAVQWLEEQGWEFERAPSTPMKVTLFDRRVYYLQNLAGGMNFGPQFRHFQMGGKINPGKPGMDKSDYTTLAVSGLQEASSWEMDMKYRPGIQDVFNTLALGQIAEN